MLPGGVANRAAWQMCAELRLVELIPAFDCGHDRFDRDFDHCAIDHSGFPIRKWLEVMQERPSWINNEWRMRINYLDAWRRRQIALFSLSSMTRIRMADTPLKEGDIK